MQITSNTVVRAGMHQQSMLLMGNRFEITVVGDDEAWAIERIAVGVQEIKRIEKLLTTFAESSETNKVNQAAGIAPVQVSEETFRLIQRLWNFDASMTRLPDEKTARRMVRLINYRNIILDEKEKTVFLKEHGMRIGFGGIGKGYAAEMAKRVMRAAGVQSGIVNASGDLTCWGTQPGGQPWTIGIVNPNLKEKIFSYMSVTDMAVATSGNYEKFVLINGKKYSHTINPRTGLPVSGIKSVTIITPNAEIADAMATPVTIMGIKAGLDMINQVKDIEAIVIDDNDIIYTSNNLHFT
jgi:FAD:protein FMN transferase